MSTLNGLMRWGAAAAAAAILMGPVLAADDKGDKAKEGDQTWVTKPFNGKDLEGWVAKGKDFGAWMVGTAKLDANDATKFVVAKTGDWLINSLGHSFDLYSKSTYGDQILMVEVMVPKGSNSGIYLQGEYEVQVLDSFGKDANPGPGDMGGIYGGAAPKGPKYKKPGEWQTFEIHFQAPKFDADGKKAANAKFVKVVLNGDVIHENVEAKAPTGGGVDNKEKAMGPIMFQGNHGAVAFRNLSIEPLK
jgi:hypothetical protein